MTDFANEVLRILQEHAVGRRNAIRADVIASLIGTTWRKVEKAVEELRNRGVFVASARTGRPRGIFLPASDAEMQDALGSFRRATITQITTYNRLKRARRIAVRFAGQSTLFSSSQLATHNSPLTDGAQKGR